MRKLGGLNRNLVEIHTYSHHMAQHQDTGDESTTQFY